MTKAKFEARVTLNVEAKEEGQTSKLQSVDTVLVMGPNVDHNAYFKKDGLPNEVGTKVMSQCFVQGLAANIAYGDMCGFNDKAEHLEYVISELRRAVESGGRVTNGFYGHEGV